jgi:ankyrin repeat protein
MYEQESAVKLFLGAGSQVDQANNNGVTPLMAAARDGFTPIVKLLLEAGADYNQVDEFGRTADSVADEKGFPETRDAVKEFAEAATAKEKVEE